MKRDLCNVLIRMFWYERFCFYVTDYDLLTGAASKFWLRLWQ